MRKISGIPVPKIGHAGAGHLDHTSSGKMKNLGANGVAKRELLGDPNHRGFKMGAWYATCKVRRMKIHERVIMRRGFFVFITTLGVIALLISALKISANQGTRLSDHRISRVSLVESANAPADFAGSFTAAKVQ